MLHQLPNVDWTGSTALGSSFVYQPIIALADRRVFCVEQLARFGAVGENDKPSADTPFMLGSGAPTPSAQTIAEMEASGAIIGFDLHAIKTALNVLSVRPDLRISVNLSGATISNRAGCDHMMSILHANRLPAHRLCLEITETHSISNLLFAAEIVGFLQEYRVIVAVDDFGKGNSTDLYLTTLSPDVVKVDASPGGLDPAEALDLAKRAKQAGALTVMEGIETAAQSARLTAPWVDMQQGYYFGRPAMLSDAPRIGAITARSA